MRIASCNILHGVDVRRFVGTDQTDPSALAGLTADAVDLDAVADWIAGLDADVVALQEVDQRLPRSGEVDQVAWLADRLGYEGVFCPALEGNPDTSWREVAGDTLATSQGGYGVGLLSRVGLADLRRTRLPHGGPGSREPGASPTNPGVDNEPRVAVSALVAGDLRVSTTHLSYMFWRAIPQLGRAMSAATDGHDGRGVFVGDINLPMWAGWLALHGRGLHPWGWPDGATRDAGWRYHRGLATYPSWNPRLQLDQVFGRNLPSDPRVTVGPAGPSDHLPLLVEL